MRIARGVLAAAVLASVGMGAVVACVWMKDRYGVYWAENPDQPNEEGWLAEVCP